LSRPSLIGCEQQPKQTPATQTGDTSYTPFGDTAQNAYDSADLNTAYKFFYPTVSIAATWKGNEAAGLNHQQPLHHP
jgi:hypothetical protein